MSTNLIIKYRIPLLIWCCFMLVFMFQTVSTGRIRQDINGKLITVISDQDQLNRQPQPQPMDSSSMAQSDNTMRAASFMVDPLIIIALIALPTIGMLGLSSLVMPLIPIGIYLIQQFFPAGVGRRRRRKRRSFSPSNPTTTTTATTTGPNTMLLEAVIEHVFNKDTIEMALENFEKMLQKYNQHH